MIFPSELTRLAEASQMKVITQPQQNLRSKIESLIRSIDNLEAKRSRIDYELKKQKRSLARKRMELKKDSKHLRAKTESALQSGALNESFHSRTVNILNQDSSLLQRSAEILDNF